MRTRLPHRLYSHLFLFACGLIGSTRQAQADNGMGLPVASPYQCLRNFYVSTQGSDQNSGTSPSAAFATFQHAANMPGLQGGDCVIAMPGTYNESFAIFANGSGDTPTGYVVFKSQIPHAAKLVCPVANNPWEVVLFGNYQIIDGFDVSGAAGTGLSSGSGYPATSHLHHQKFLNNLAHDNGATGIGAGEADYITIQGNIIHDNAQTFPYGGSGISLYGSVADFDNAPGFHNIISQNIVYKNYTGTTVVLPHTDGNGIVIDSNYNFQAQDPVWLNVHYPYQTLVENNLVVNNGGEGIKVFASGNVTVRNNTVYHNDWDPQKAVGTCGELSNIDASSNTWANNIADANASTPCGAVAIVDYSPPGGDAATSSPNANVQWINNLIFNGTPGQASVDLVNTAGVVTLTNGNLLGVDPLLGNPSIDTTTWNFELSSQSPAISTGSLNHPSVDLIGTPRPAGLSDLGAYQHSGSSHGTSWYATTWHGSAFRNVKDFGAKGDGTTDDTAAIQAAINYNQPLGIKIPAVVYVPPGTYKISNTIVLWFQTQLMGEEAAPPTFILAANSPGFSNPSLKKPVLVTAGGTNVDPATLNWQANGDTGGSANNTFFIQIHNLNLSLQSGNPGAVGILWKVAQQTSLRNLTITSADAAIGIDLGGSTDYVGGFAPTQPGGGTIEDVSITGGNTGLRAVFPAQWTLRSVHIQDQTATGVLITACWALSFVDLEVSNVPVGMSYNSGVMLNILDSRFQSTGHALVTDGSPYYVENTVGVTPPGSAQFSGVGYTDGVALSTGSVPMTRTTPMMLRSRPALYPVSGTIINVHDLGAHGDGVTDDTTILQQAINQYDTVFLPFGTYLISNTLTLRPNSRIFGEAETQLMLAAGAPGFSDPSHPKPMILAPDNASAQTVMANFQIVPGPIGTPNNLGAILIQWGAGSASGIWDVCPFGNGNDSVPDAIQLNLIGHGGGVFSNMWMPGHASISGFLGNSSGPAWFYSMEAEHHITHGFTISQAANYYFVTPQTENSPTAFEVDGSTHIWAYTLAGSVFTPQPSELLKFSSSHDLSIQGFLLHDLADYCITMPTTPGGSCQLLPGTPIPGFSFTFLSLLRFSPLIISTPSLASVNPTAITAGDPDFSLLLNGMDLLSGCSAYWNGVGMPTSFMNTTQVSASVPASYFVSVGTAAVQIINPDGGVSNILSFSIVPPPQTPDLSGWPAAISIDGTLNLPSQPGSTYQWIFTPETVTSPSAIIPHGTSSGNGASTLTQAPALSLSALTLGPGPYTVQVVVINAAGKQSAPAQATITLVTASNDLSGVRMYPNPFRSARGDSQVTFDQMPAGCTVKIFTVSARLVTTLSAPAGIVSWNLTNDSGDNVASGIYLTLITDGQGSQARGKLTVIR